MNAGGRIALALLAAAVTAVGGVAPVSAAPSTAQTYNGPAYSPDLGNSATRPESQSKLWFHDGAWWALLLEPTGRTVRVFELMPDHSWRPTSAVLTEDAGDAGDALRDGDTVHVASRHGDGSLHYVRLTYDGAARDYRADEPRLVVSHGGRAAATIARDTTGRLWIGYATPIRVVVSYSDDGVTWSPNIVLAARPEGGPSEMAALVAYDDRVGVLWSDQSTDSLQFASHRDGEDPNLWTREEAMSGGAQADDHMNLHRVAGESGDTLVAAVKTSRGDVLGDPDHAALIEILKRTPDGRWTSAPAGSIADDVNDPIVLVDEEARTLHLFASRQGSIVTKQASLDDLQFESGTGQVFMRGVAAGLFNPTSTKESVSSETGLVVLASDIAGTAYRHAEAALGDTPPRADFGEAARHAPPEQLRALDVSAGTVTLSWAEVVDTDSWAPAQDGAPARAYVVLRDGEEIATVTEPLVRDEVRDGAAASRPSTVQYAVQAVDEAGNRSEPAIIAVDLPAADQRGDLPLVPMLVAVGLLVAAGGIFVLLRRRAL